MKVPILIPNIFNHPFTYESDFKLKVGDYVVVPFGKSELTGVVWDDFEKKTEKKLPVKKFNVGGFSKVEKRNLLLTPITSALLQARTMPGESQLGSVFRSIGKGMETLPQTQLAIKQIELQEKARRDAKAEKLRDKK